MNRQIKGEIERADSPFLTISEGAQLIRASEATLRRRLTQRKLTRYKQGSRTLLLRSEVMALVRPEA